MRCSTTGRVQCRRRTPAAVPSIQAIADGLDQGAFPNDAPVPDVLLVEADHANDAVAAGGAGLR